MKKRKWQAKNKRAELAMDVLQLGLEQLENAIVAAARIVEGPGVLRIAQQVFEERTLAIRKRMDDPLEGSADVNVATWTPMVKKHKAVWDSVRARVANRS